MPSSLCGGGMSRNTAATGLDLTPRETPQSITIITREQIDDQAASTVADVLEWHHGPFGQAGRPRPQPAVGARLRHHKLPARRCRRSRTGNVGLEDIGTAIFERVEVIRGATGLLPGAGEPARLDQHGAQARRRA